MKKTYPPPLFKEHVSSISDENHDSIHFRVKSCLNVLPVKSSNVASLSCINCKKLIRNNKHIETNRENVPSVINNEIQSTCVSNEILEKRILTRKVGILLF